MIAWLRSLFLGSDVRGSRYWSDHTPRPQKLTLPKVTRAEAMAELVRKPRVLTFRKAGK